MGNVHSDNESPFINKISSIAKQAQAQQYELHTVAQRDSNGDLATIIKTLQITRRSLRLFAMGQQASTRGGGGSGSGDATNARLTEKTGAF